MCSFSSGMGAAFPGLYSVDVCLSLGFYIVKRGHYPEQMGGGCVSQGSVIAANGGGRG